MDRMLEVNKVASLMRRCENPKPLVLPSTLGDSAVQQRGHFDPVLGKWGAGDSAPRSLRLSLAGSPFAFRSVEWPDERRATSASPAPARRLAVAPREGRALRVSASAGFRIPKPAVPAVGGKRSPVSFAPRALAVKPPTASAAAVAPGTGTARTVGLKVPPPRIRFAPVSSTVAPAVRRISAWRWRDAAPAPVPLPAVSRTAAVPFTSFAETSSGPAPGKESRYE
jgi:hypothetical protein